MIWSIIQGLFAMLAGMLVWLALAGGVMILAAVIASFCKAFTRASKLPKE